MSLSELRLVNFKAFADETLDLRGLTLLTGLNGVGKSTVIQALLALRQSYLQANQEAKFPGLELNGDLVQLGLGSDVLYEKAENDVVEISLKTSSGFGETLWSFNYERQADVLSLDEARTVIPDVSAYDEALFKYNFHYLQAERLGPRRVSEMSEYRVKTLGDMGSDGRYAIHFLSLNGDKLVAEFMADENEADRTLKAQTTAWMGHVSPGVKFDIRQLESIDLLRLGVSFDGSKFYRATNVGFGISYVLPIVVALLSSQAGGLVLLENPEAHLHPQGQVKMGELMARAAAAGVQVICETHSDHILNGVRLAVKQKLLQPDQLAMHFFERENGKVIVQTPELDEDGRLDYRPEGFFDEYGNSMRNLM